MMLAFYASYPFFVWGTIAHAWREIISEKGPREMTDPTEPTEEQQDPAVAPGIKAIIEAATGLTWAHFAARHPRQAAGIERNLGGKPIVPEIIAVLETDGAYQALVEKTVAERDVAGVFAGIAPIVIDAILMIMAR